MPASVTSRQSRGLFVLLAAMIQLASRWVSGDTGSRLRVEGCDFRPGFATSRLGCWSPDLFPKRDLRWFGDQLAEPGQHRLQLRLLQVPIQMGFAGPVLVEQERRGVIQI